MAHELEQHKDGRTAFVAGNNMAAWHRLGTVKAGNLTVDDLMTDGLLGGWKVRTEPLLAAVPGKRCIECAASLNSQHDDMCGTGDEAEAEARKEAGAEEFDPGNQGRNPYRLVVPDDATMPMAMPGWFTTLRDHPVTGNPEPLGPVQGGYSPIQNEELAEILQALVDEYGAVFDTGGSLRGGREVFMSLKLPEGVQIAGHDAHNLNLVGMNSHDGTRALELVTSMTRVVCANTQAIALRNYQSRFSIRHVSGAKNRIAEARSGLKLTFKVAEEFQKEAEKLFQVKMTDKEFQSFCEVIWPQDKVKNLSHSLSEYHRRGAHLLKLFREAPTQENCRNTRWAALQSIGEYVDHFIPVRTKKDEAVTRANRALFGKGHDIKAKAFKLLQEA